MKRQICFNLIKALTVLLVCVFSVGNTSAADGVCSAGLGMPPFLSSGVDPNLLLVLDNSGSMLDMAYQDRDTDGEDIPTTDIVEGTGDIKTQCFDEGYLQDENGTQDTTIEYAGYFEKDSWYVWESGTFPYNHPSKESSTDPWVAPWQQGGNYTAGQIVYANGGLYKATNTNVSNDTKPQDGFNLSGDTVVKWESVSQSTTVLELPGSCVDDETKTYNNSVYICKSNSWKRLEGGQFIKIENSDPKSACGNSIPDKNIIVFSNDDLCISVENELVSLSSGETITVNKRMIAFAAKGNFLNWASASKFDVQKKILTGGKYENGTKQLISESRGCAGYGYVKQVDVNGMKLVMKVRGADDFDRVGDKPSQENIDDTTRIEVIGIKNSVGFIQQTCQDLIDKIDQTGNITQNQIDSCLGAGNETGTSQAALSLSVNICRNIDFNKDGTITQDEVPNLTKTVAYKCESLFKNYGYSPWSMSPADGGYVCYGIYDGDIDHDKRIGYLGRCWNYGDDPLSVCVKKPEVSAVNGGCDRGDADRCLYCTMDPLSGKCTQDIYKNEGYNFKCIDIKGNKIQGYYCASPDDNSDWELLGVDSGGNLCTLADASTGVWDPLFGESDTFGESSLSCIAEGMIDFCQDLKVPEVIDPSDQATTTSEYWNVPAMVIDGGALSQMGVAKPLAVMKGLIKYDLPADQTIDPPARPDGPRGVLYEVAKDIRIGVMAFNNVGSKYEITASGGNSNPTIIKYNPIDNKDGAHVISQIDNGMFIDDKNTPNVIDDVEIWDHYKDIIKEINEVRATTWTPLAEAMYTALSYYGQNKVKSLNDTDLADSDGIPWPDPVKYWCQSNHVLFITEGASTADVHSEVSKFVSTSSTTDGDNEIGICPNGLQGSSYLDDLTYFGQHAKVTDNLSDGGSPLYSRLIATGEDNPKYEMQPITTHIVTTGFLSSDGSDSECNPYNLMTNAADNGRASYMEKGSNYYPGEDPASLEKNLKKVFNDILGRASAGSAASVISSARSGEGAIYQAIFWPERDNNIINPDTGKFGKISWVGDVHGLFIDDRGYMYEDSFEPPETPDHTLIPSQDLDGDGRLDCGVYKIVDGKLVIDTSKLIAVGDNSKNEVDENNDGIPDVDYDKDLNLDSQCEAICDATGNCSWKPDGDKRVIVYFDKDEMKSKACYNQSVVDSNGKYCTNSKKLEDVKFLWSANHWLAQSSRDLQILNNRGVVDGQPYSFSNEEKDRRDIFTWIDKEGVEGNRNGIVEYNNDEVVSLDASQLAGRYKDFNAVDDIELGKIIQWVRGKDQDGYRSRSIDLDGIGGENSITWRLGDIINSTPQTVTSPSEAYHLLYHDASYVPFVQKYKKRRHVVYFGGNDGMLHAVNAGFFSEDEKKFCMTELVDGKCPENDINGNYPALGMELWAYVPYNLHPHLKCLTLKENDDTEDVEGYEHKYYVDLKPRVFDVQIFEEESDCTNDKYNVGCIHPNGWGTILVGGMRFGGAPTEIELVFAGKDGEIGTDDDVKKKQPYISSYFILDITNPEQRPILLGELTKDADNVSNVDLGYSTVLPTLAIVKTVDDPITDTKDETSNRWYLVLGSGPHGPNAMKGESDQTAKVSAVYLGGTGIDGKADVNGGLVGGDNKPIRPFRVYQESNTPVISKTFDLPPAATTAPTTTASTATSTTTEASATTTTETNVVPPPTYGFVSDPVTIDFDINPALAGQYVSDAIYFGTVEAANETGTVWQGGGGHLYRLVMNGVEHTIKKDDATALNLWEITTLIDLSASNTVGNPIQPITAAPSIGMDDDGKYWVYFGTGRFFDPDDKQDATQQSFYGIREPMDSEGIKLTWDTVTISDLLRVDQLNVKLATKASDALISCNDTVVGNCPSLTAFPTLDKLETYIATNTDGWYKLFAPYQNRERNLGQATLLGGLVTFTTYQPFEDLCKAEGESYLYGVYYKTGTSWHENVFGEHGIDTIFVKNKIDLGRGLTTTPSLFTGSGEKGVRAFVQTSTGAILEIKQDNLPIGTYRTGSEGWKEFER